ncbi:MAG TPA: nuclear transport factor 2 family protein [Terriglobales bacterium]|nr:nuclear transport factor 2 family protein [Terriglobales bacterium]
MLTETFARQFAADWIHAWNSHELEAIMSHYAEDVVLTSPAAAKLLGEPSGLVQGKEDVREYFRRGLEAFPQLKFSLVDVFWGVSSVVLCFENQRGTRTAEFMEIDAEKLIMRVIANYNG